MKLNKPYLKDIMNNLRKSATWKIKLTIAINFISFKDTAEERIMHSKSGNIEVMVYDKANEYIENVLNYFLIYIKLDWKHQ